MEIARLVVALLLLVVLVGCTVVASYETDAGRVGVELELPAPEVGEWSWSE